jgi:hypothetical protein
MTCVAYSANLLLLIPLLRLSIEQREGKNMQSRITWTYA